MKKIIDNYISELIEEQPVDLAEKLYFSTFPGRRNRSTLLLKLANGDSTHSSLLHCATAIELAHRSSIIIDDFLDDDSERRGFASFHTKYGLESTILISNLLNSLAYGELVKYYKISDVSLFDEFTSCYQKMVIGELGDINLVKINKNENVLEFYEKTVLGKTNPPFVFLLSVISKSRLYNSHTINLYKSIGEQIGNLYQMYNDMYDELYSDPMERGKRIDIQSTLSFVKSFSLSNNFITEKEKEELLNSIGSSITIEKFIKFRKVLSSKNSIKSYNDYLKDKKAKLIKDIESLEDSDTEILKEFVERFISKSSWDHHEFGNAGY